MSWDFSQWTHVKMEERVPWTSSATRRTATSSVVVQTALPEVSARLTSTNATETRVNLEGLAETLPAAIFANAKQGIYLYITQVEQNSCQESVMNYNVFQNTIRDAFKGRRKECVLGCPTPLHFCFGNSCPISISVLRSFVLTKM